MLVTRARGYKAFFMLNLTEHEISTAHKNMLKKRTFLAFKLSVDLFIMLINVKMPTIIGILTFMSTGDKNISVIHLNVLKDE